MKDKGRDITARVLIYLLSSLLLAPNGRFSLNRDLLAIPKLLMSAVLTGFVVSWTPTEI